MSCFHTVFNGTTQLRLCWLFHRHCVCSRTTTYLWLHRCWVFVILCLGEQQCSCVHVECFHAAVRTTQLSTICVECLHMVSCRITMQLHVVPLDIVLKKLLQAQQGCCSVRHSKKTLNTSSQLHYCSTWHSIKILDTNTTALLLDWIQYIWQMLNTYAIAFCCFAQFH